VGPDVQQPIRQLVVVKQASKAMFGEVFKHGLSGLGIRAGQELSGSIEQQGSQILECALGIVGDGLNQGGEDSVIGTGILGGLRHDGDLGLHEIGVGNVIHHASHKIKVKRARDGLSEEHGGCRWRRAWVQVSRGQVVPGDVGDDVGGNACLAQHVGGAADVPVGQV
jgi:hypothetical protein